MEKLTQGLVQIYTGNSKGKSTAAFGLTVRAIGHGFKVFIIQFMKGQGNYGELKTLKQLEPLCTVQYFGGFGWVHKGNPSEEDLSEATRAMNRAEEIVLSGNYDIVILDEIINAVWFELIPEEKVLELISQKPTHVELVLTGRNASEHLIEKADLVTEMLQIKHPFENGIGARKGIEY